MRKYIVRSSSFTDVDITAIPFFFFYAYGVVHGNFIYLSRELVYAVSAIISNNSCRYFAKYFLYPRKIVARFAWKIIVFLSLVILRQNLMLRKETCFCTILPFYLNANTYSFQFFISFFYIYTYRRTRMRSIPGIWCGIKPLAQVEYYNLKAYLCCCRCTCVKPEAEDSENGRI